MGKYLDIAKRVPSGRERAARLLFWLECEGYEVSTNGDTVRVCCPKDALSDGLRDRIRELKPWLIAILSERGRSRDAR